MMPSSLCVAATTPPGDSWNMSRQIRRSRLARALHLALGLALGVALHAASAGAQGTSIEQLPPGNSTGNPGGTIGNEFAPFPGSATPATTLS